MAWRRPGDKPLSEPMLVFVPTHICVTRPQLNPWQQGSWGQHGSHLGPTGPRWAPCWPHELCCLGSIASIEIQAHTNKTGYCTTIHANCGWYKKKEIRKFYNQFLRWEDTFYMPKYQELSQYTSSKTAHIYKFPSRHVQWHCILWNMISTHKV